MGSRWRVAALAWCLLLVAGALQAAQQGSWIHVRVDDQDGEQVDLNLPLSAAELVLDLVELEADVSGSVRINDRDVEIAELRSIWTDVRQARDGEIMRIQRDGERVLISKSEDVLHVVVEPTQGREKVKLMVPVQVVDALFSGERDTLDLKAAVSALRYAPRGDVLRVEDGHSNVHVWID
jgi:hypothetical protein